MVTEKKNFDENNTVRRCRADSKYLVCLHEANQSHSSGAWADIICSSVNTVFGRRHVYYRMQRHTPSDDVVLQPHRRSIVCRHRHWHGPPGTHSQRCSTSPALSTELRGGPQACSSPSSDVRGVLYCSGRSLVGLALFKVRLERAVNPVVHHLLSLWGSAVQYSSGRQLAHKGPCGTRSPRPCRCCRGPGEHTCRL